MRNAFDRDRAVRRVQVLTRGAVAGSVALSAGFAALIAIAQPAKARAASAPTRSSAAGARRSTTARRSSRAISPTVTAPVVTAPAVISPGAAPPVTDPPADPPAGDFRSLREHAQPAAAGAGLQLGRRRGSRVGPVVTATAERATFSALGTTAVVLVADPSTLSEARRCGRTRRGGGRPRMQPLP